MSARLRNLNPYELHKYLVNVYCLNTALLTRDKSKDRTDLDVIRENHKFLWEDDDEADTWEKQLAKKYYDKLFKEYCICDLSRFKENKVALRWRVEKEVVMGKGQFVCGNKQCSRAEELRSWEVNFAYKEEGEARNALVKIRLCPECSDKLNYRSKKREIKRLKKEKKRKTKSKDSDTVEGEQEVVSGGDGDGDQVGDGDDEQALASTSEPMDEEAAGSESLWKKGVQEVEEKSREEEFADYLEDLLL